MARLRLETPERIGIPSRSVGAVEQFLAEAVALGAEGEDRAGGQVGRAQVVAVGVDRDQRPVGRRQPRDPGDGEREVQAGGAAEGVGVPGVVLAGGEERGRRGRGGDPDAGAHVPHRPRVLEEDDRLRPRTGQQRLDVDLRTAGDRDDAGARRLRHQLRQHLGSDRRRPAGECPLEVGRELPRQLLELGGVRGRDLVDLGPEPERVLQRVEPLEHGQAWIAARGSIPGDQRSLAAHLPLAAINSGYAQPGPPLLGVEATPARSPPGTFRGR